MINYDPHRADVKKSCNPVNLHFDPFVVINQNPFRPNMVNVPLRGCFAGHYEQSVAPIVRRFGESREEVGTVKR